MARVRSLIIDSAGWTSLLLAYSEHCLWQKVRLTTNHALPGRPNELVDDGRYQGERKPVVSEVGCLLGEIACSSMDIVKHTLQPVVYWLARCVLKAGRELRRMARS